MENNEYKTLLAPLLSLPVSRLQVKFTTTWEFDTKGIGPVLRGRMGKRIKHSACLFPDDPTSLCLECAFKENCPYILLFAPLPPAPLLLPDGKVRHVPSPLRPFVMGLDTENRILRAWETGYLTLNLFGPCIRECVYFLKTAMATLLTFPTEITETGFLLPPGSEAEKGNVFPLSAWVYETDTGQKETDTLELNFLTPLSLFKGKKPVREDISFFHIVQAAVRRLRDLKRSFHMDGQMGDLGTSFFDPAGQVETAENHLSFRRFKRYSGRQGQDVYLDGWEGKIVFKGPFQPFLPLLRAAEIVHIGKGSSNGNGRFSIIRL